MPVLAQVQATGGGNPPVEPPVDPPVDPGTGEPTPEAPSGAPASSLTLTTADGTAYDLGDPTKLLATLGRRGFDAAQYATFADESPLVDGEIFRGARAVPRDLILPIYLRADTRAEFLTRKRDLLARLAPTRGLATLEVAEEDGSRRRISCYFTGRGAEGEGSRDRSGRTWTRYNLELRCPDPYWRGDPLRVEFVPPNVGGLFFPLLPLKVESAQTFGETSFTNPGDVMSYPVWTIHGPVAGSLVLKRTTPGLTVRTLTLNLTVASGHFVTVDTRPDRLAIVDDLGANKWPSLADGSSLWRINPGENSIEVVVPGSGAGTRIVLDAEPRFETA